MQPLQFPVNLDQLTLAWRRFIETGTLEPQVDLLVAASWRRCLPRCNPRSVLELPRLSEESPVIRGLSFVLPSDRRDERGKLIALPIQLKRAASRAV